MRTLAVICLLSSVLCTAGCQHIPPGKAEEVHERTSVLGVTSTADFTGINATEKTVRAASASFTLSFPGFDHTTTAKNLILTNPPAEHTDKK